MGSGTVFRRGRVVRAWFLRGGRAKTKLVSKEYFARGFRTVSSRERAMEGDPCDSGRVPIVRKPLSKNNWTGEIPERHKEP
jgi:hypothetical protein